MNKNLLALINIAKKENKYILGLMSGTSVDGLDVALCQINGYGINTQITLKEFKTISYTTDFKNDIKSIFSKKNIDLEKLCLMHAYIGIEHARMINECLDLWKLNAWEIDAIASHGQTIYHAPQKLHQQVKFSNATLQIGDADHIAVNTGIITLSDFRQKHVAAGGEGAPLAVYGDFLIFSSNIEDRIMLNIGGIANFTHLPKTKNINDVFSTDVGPGNTMMDAYVQQYFTGLYYDKDAAIATSGIVNEKLLAELLNHSFFHEGFPKTTGPELFNLNYLQNAQAKSNSLNESHANIMATLNKFSAVGIAQSILRTQSTRNPFCIYSSGGGMHNPLLMQHLKQMLPSASFKTTQDLHINPDAKEAVLFAVLANECLVGEGFKTATDNQGIPNVTMGKISFPW